MPVSMLSRRILALVFGPFTMAPPREATIDSSIVIVLASKSTSLQRSAQASPLLTPVAVTTRTNAATRWSSSAHARSNAATSVASGARTTRSASIDQFGSSVSATGFGKPLHSSAVRGGRCGSRSLASVAHWLLRGHRPSVCGRSARSRRRSARRSCDARSSARREPARCSRSGALWTARGPASRSASTRRRRRSRSCSTPRCFRDRPHPWLARLQLPKRRGLFVRLVCCR